MTDLDRRIDKFNTKTAHVLWIVFVSMVTSIIVVSLSTASVERSQLKLQQESEQT